MKEWVMVRVESGNCNVRHSEGKGGKSRIGKNIGTGTIEVGDNDGKDGEVRNTVAKIEKISIGS
jgi:hypothetical protein